MFLMIRRTGQPAFSKGQPASGMLAGLAASGLSIRALVLATLGVCLMMGWPGAHAQQAGGKATAGMTTSLGSDPSSASAAASQNAGSAGSSALTALMALTASPSSSNTASPAGDQSDPVSRFLSDKGLLPNTKPVVELAQQMRDKATDVASELVLSAMNFLGVPYRRGGNSRESGFDCSGFTRHVFENSVGLILPRRASEQANSPDLVPVKKNELKPGDLVFFNTLRRTFSHVGIYVGDDKFIHSPRAVVALLPVGLAHVFHADLAAAPPRFRPVNLRRPARTTEFRFVGTRRCRTMRGHE
jgi:cell wall-associated NlpC family hydrolase